MKIEIPALIFEPFPSPDLERFLEDNIVGHNLAKTGVSEWHPVGYFLRNRRGEWQGGCTGYVWGGWLHVRWLWVTEALRGGGQGTRLLNAAEEMARERGAAGSTLETHSFQALHFYQSRGYTVFGTLEDYPVGHAKYFLRKTLNGTRD